MLCTIPIAFVSLKLGATPSYVFVSLLFTTLTAQFVRMVLCRKLFCFSIKEFLAKVILPILKVGVACFLPLLLLRPLYVGYGGFSAILVCAALDVWVAVCVLLLGLSKVECDFLLRKLRLK